MRRSVAGQSAGLAAIAALAGAIAMTGRAEPPATHGPVVHVYVREGCPHCLHAEQYLERLSRRYPEVTIERHDVVRDPEARDRLQAALRAAGIAQAAVPTFVIGERVLVGFAGPATERQVEAALFSEHGTGRRVVELPLFGALDPRVLGLPLFTLAIALVDGFNPCAMWVLLFVLSLLVHLKSRPKMALIGGTFVVVSGLVYFAFMAAWLNFFLLVGVSRPVQIVLGFVAIAVGSVHVKDFVAFKQGLSLSIPEAAKPGIYRRARRILQAENLVGAMAAVIVLAVMVNTVELLCTAGLPAIYTQVLTSQGVSTAARYAYLALYNVVYMLDDAFVLVVAVVTLSHRKLQERGARVLKLVSGAVMVALGLLLIARPEWLTWGGPW